MRQGAFESGSKIAILMTSYRNTEFLGEQIDSLKRQDWPNVDLWISRDCDDQELGRLLDDHARSWRQARTENEDYRVISGPRRGSSANFLSMVHHPDIQADYYAFCDHDDRWDKDRLSRAISALQGIPRSLPALYASRVRFISAKGKQIGISGYCLFPPSFRNALRENMANGCTMVFNRAARDILQASQVHEIPWHDWWTYLLISAAGGKVVYDSRPSLDYRLHSDNLSGLSSVLEGYRARFARDAKRLQKTIAEKLSKFIPAIAEKPAAADEWKDEVSKDDGINYHELYFSTLQSVENLVSEKNIRVMDRYERYLKGQGRFDKTKALLASGVYHQKPQDSIEMLLRTLK